VRYLYEEFVCLFYDLSREDIQELLLVAFETIPCSKFYLEAIPLVVFTQLQTKIMHAAGVHDFGLMDLFEPTYDRTRRNISAIINLGKYREEKVLLFANQSEKINTLMRKIVTVETYNINVRKKIELIDCKQDTDRLELDKIDKKNETSDPFFLRHQV
jgi:hypothetical protein